MHVSKYKQQKGFGLMNFVFLLIALGIIVSIAVQATLIAIQKKTVSDSVELALKEIGKKDNASPSAISNNIIKRLNVNSIDLKKEDMVVTKEGGQFKVWINLTKEIKLSDHITVIVDSSVEKIGP